MHPLLPLTLATNKYVSSKFSTKNVSIDFRFIVLQNWKTGETWNLKI